MQQLANPRVVVGLVLLVVIAYGAWMTGAANNRVQPVDAVVVHAGGEGERLSLALDIMTTDNADTLVVMRGNAPEWPAGNSVCVGNDEYEVICPMPDPDSTIGEAEALNLLVSQRGWESVIAVTSDYHLRRATHLDRQCNADLTVLAQGAKSDLGILRSLQRTVWEMAAMPQALFAC